MKYLIIPDVHCRNFWRQAIANNQADKIIFLGDYLDPYGDEFENPDKMEGATFYDVDAYMRMLNDIIGLKKNEPNKYILLTGNHTDGYIWSDFASASRQDREHWDIYHYFFKENLKYFNFVWKEKNVIFSHAGITEGWAHDFLYKYMEYEDSNIIDCVSECADILMNTSLEDFNKYYIQAISNISYYRGGCNFNGSCEWADLKEHVNLKESITKIIPKGIDGIYQVFGHTQVYNPLITDKWACLDCRKAFIIDIDTFEITEC